jgi:hypothetical protein
MVATAWSHADADVHVRGYYRKNGTYVRPHMRSNPDGNPWNNWSTLGNRNPYTGKPGTKVPRSSTAPARDRGLQLRPYEDDFAEDRPDRLTPAEQARIEADAKARVVESLYKSAVAAEERAWEEADRRALDADEERARAAAAERRSLWEQDELARRASDRAQLAAKLSKVAPAWKERRQSLEAKAKRDARGRLKSELQRYKQALERADAAAEARDLEKIEDQELFSKIYRGQLLNSDLGKGIEGLLEKGWPEMDERRRIKNELRLAENAEARAEKRTKAIARFTHEVVRRLKAGLAAYSHKLDDKERQAKAKAEAKLAENARSRRAEFERSEAAIIARERAEIAANAARRAASRSSAGQNASAAGEVGPRPAADADRTTQVASWVGWAMGLLCAGIAAVRGVGRLVALA